MKATVEIAALAFFIIAYPISAPLAKTIRIASSGVGGLFLPLWVGQDRGIFKKFGLDTEVITIQGGPLAVQALLAGSTQFHVGGTSSIVDAKIQGAQTVTLAVFTDTLPYILVASHKIKSASQLKGARFAVSRLGSASDLALGIALKNLGVVDPEEKPIILGVGDQTSRFGALRSGAVDATVISPPLTVTARKLGFNLIASFQDAGITWAYNSIDTTSDFAKNNRQIVLGFLKAFIESMAYICKNKEESLALLAHWMRLKDRESLEETYDYLVKILPKKPYSSEKGIQAVLDAIAVRNLNAKKFRPQDFTDMQYLREIDESGFIEKIYR